MGGLPTRTAGPRTSVTRMIGLPSEMSLDLVREPIRAGCQVRDHLVARPSSAGSDRIGRRTVQGVEERIHLTWGVQVRCR